MFHHVKDDVQFGDVVIRLNTDPFQELFRAQRREESHRLIDGCAQALFEARCGLLIPRGKFDIADPVIGFASDAVEDPLAHVAGKMQDQVPDGILIFTATGPDLMGCEAVQTGFDAFPRRAGRAFQRSISGIQLRWWT